MSPIASIADVFVTVLPETAAIAKGIEKALRSVDARKIGRELGRELQQGLTDPEVHLKADTKEAEAKLDKATEDRTATVEVELDGAAKAEAKLDAVARDRKAEIKVDVDGAAVGTAINAAVSGAGSAGSVGAKMGTQIAESFAQSFMSAMKGPAGIAIGGAVAVGIGSAGLQLAGVAASLTGLIGLFPAGQNRDTRLRAVGLLAEDFDPVAIAAPQLSDVVLAALVFDRVAQRSKATTHDVFLSRDGSRCMLRPGTACGRGPG